MTMLMAHGELKLKCDTSCQMFSNVHRKRLTISCANASPLFRLDNDILQSKVGWLSC